ncbi:MAG: TrmH family RNA methyltransferase [Propionibacteriaceae bacterium]
MITPDSGPPDPGRRDAAAPEGVTPVEPIPVERADDPRLADYVQLRDVALRRHLESDRGLFIAEGEKVIRRAVRAGGRPRSFLLAHRWLAGLRDVLAEHPDVPVYVVSEALAEQVTGFHVHRGALASLHRPPVRPMTDLLDRDRLVVLEDVVDHSNVGAILRSAAGLGWQGALLSPRCADPLYRRAVKTSMGAVFALPWARFEDWTQAIAQLRRAGFWVIALGLGAGSVPLGEVAAELRARPRKVAVLLGTEGAGLSRHWLAGADVLATIAMHAPGTADGGVGEPVDSLNVAAAAAVACYVLGPDSPAVPAASDSSSSSSESARFGPGVRAVTGQSEG